MGDPSLRLLPGLVLTGGRFEPGWPVTMADGRIEAVGPAGEPDGPAEPSAPPAAGERLHGRHGVRDQRLATADQDALLARVRETTREWTRA
jgi:hypothetical protein